MHCYALAQNTTDAWTSFIMSCEVLNGNEVSTVALQDASQLPPLLIAVVAVLPC